MAAATLALANSSSGSGIPISANTLRLPTSCSGSLRRRAVFFLLLAFAFAVMVNLLCFLQSRLHSIDIDLRRLDALHALFLERVEHVNSVVELDGVDSSKRGTVVIFDNFHHAGAAEAFHRLGLFVLLTKLR